MNDIWSVVAQWAMELHPDRMKSVADKIAKMDSADELAKTGSLLGTGAGSHLMALLLESWAQSPDVSPKELSSALCAASRTASLMEQRKSAEMVWTGPSTGLVPARHTEQVLLELIEAARSNLFLVSFVAYDISTVVAALRDADGRGVQIDLLLEATKDLGGSIDIDSAAMFRKSIPSARIYAWYKEAPTERTDGKVHAKCAVADGQTAFITSANLTSAALEHNMELDVLIRGGELPDRLDQHLHALINTGIVRLT